MLTLHAMERPLARRLLQRLKSPRLVRFGLVGLSGVFVNLGLLWVFADAIDLNDVLASAIAIELSIVWNFFLNNAWTFRDKNEGAAAGFGARLFRYNLVSLVGLGIQLATFIVLKNAFMQMFHLTDVGIWKYPAQLAGIAIAMGWNFLSNFFWTWAPSTAPAATEELEKS